MTLGRSSPQTPHALSEERVYGVSAQALPCAPTVQTLKSYLAVVSSTRCPRWQTLPIQMSRVILHRRKDIAINFLRYMCVRVE